MAVLWYFPKELTDERLQHWLRNINGIDVIGVDGDVGEFRDAAPPHKIWVDRTVFRELVTRILAHRALMLEVMTPAVLDMRPEGEE